MKWIGQHIWGLISRFRNDVYLEDIDTGTITSGGHLGLDSNNKIVKAADSGGDLTGITAGTGLSGSDLTGPVPTLNVDASQTQITSIGTIGVGQWRGTAIEHAYIGTDAIEVDNIADDQITVAKMRSSAIQTATEIASSFGDNDTSLLTAAAIDDRIRVTSKHVLRCTAFYVNDVPLVQNSLYFGSSTGNTPYNWNDPTAVGGVIGDTSSFTIIGDDENWGILLPVDISKIEVQCSLRPSLGTGDDFTLAVYTGVRSSDSSDDLTLTKIGHQSVSFNSTSQRYKQNDLTITGDYNAGTMIYVGVGSEDATDAKQARGYMNITVTER